jgi:glycosyltransferase involved in cell wall biosynthesis
LPQQPIAPLQRLLLGLPREVVAGLGIFVIDSRSIQISVLVPCFNAAKFLGAALDSVLSQTWQNIQIIVVDDGSTDDSVSVAQSYASRGVQLIQQANAGAAAARNRAFEASSGEFVLYLDADDLIGEDHLSALAERLDQHGLFVAMSPWDRFYQFPNEAKFPPRSGYVDANGAKWLAAEWASARCMTQPGMFLLPRRLVASVGGWNESLSLIDDFEFFARVISRSTGVRFAPRAKLYYRSAISGSLSARKDRKAAESELLSLTLGTQHLLDLDDSAGNRRACANLFKNFDYTHFPNYADLRATARRRVNELGGADLLPDGPPGFQKLRPFMGWQLARRAQHLAEQLRLNRAGRRLG